MKLGLNHDEVRIVDYTEEWAEEFSQVKQELIEKTNLEVEHIEHIGSTAIKGVQAKPIIDILVGVDDLEQVDKAFLKALAEAGFLRLRVVRPGEIVLAKFTDDTYKVKTHYIHLTEYQGELWNDLTFFRDYLNANEVAREEYVNVKCDYLKSSSTGIKEYTDFKEVFIKKIVARRNS